MLPSTPRPRPPLETPTGDFTHQPALNGKRAAKDYTASFDASRSSVAKRTERATTWRNPDGTYTAEVHTTPVNWRDGTGTWRAIDPTLAADGALWRNRSGPVTVAVPGISGAAPLAAVSGPGWSLSFSLAGAATGVRATVAGTTATYTALAPNLDLQEQVSATGIKELAILKRRPPAGDYRLRFPLTLVGLTATEADGGVVEFRNGAGALVATAPPAWAWDADDNPAEGGGVAVAQRLVADGAGIAIELTVPAAWLADPATRYPVAIDPTIDAGNQTSQFDAFTSNLDPNGNYNGARQWDPTNKTYVNLAGFDSWPTSEQAAYQWFDLAPVNNKTILSAQWRSWAVAKRGSGFFRLWPVSQAWDQSTVTWNNRPNHTTAFLDGTVDAAGKWQYADLTSWVAGWAANPSTSFGLSIDSAGTDSGVRFAASEAGATYNSAIFITYNTRPVPSEPTSPQNAESFTTDRPTLSATATSDPDGDPVSYWFRMSTAPDGFTGSTVNSGWITSPTWTPPAGVLVDGATYFWRVYTYDTTEVVDQTAFVRKVRVNLRMGAGSVSPSDAMGPVSVNLATGNATISAASPTFDTVGGPMGLTYTYNSKAPETFGLMGTYEGTALPQYVRMVRRDRQLDFNWGEGSPGAPIPPNDFRITWTGFVTVPAASANWRFGAVHDDGVKITVGPTVVLDTTGVSGTPEYGTGIAMAANQTLPIKVEYAEGIGSAYLQLYADGPTGSAPVPASWLSTVPTAMPQGWTLSTPTGGGLAYAKLEPVGNHIVLTDPAGGAHGFAFLGNAASPAGSYLWSSVEPGGETITYDVANAWFVVHGADGIDYRFTTAGQLHQAVSVTDGITSPASPVHGYDASNGRLRTITDPVTARAITVYYGADGAASCPTGSGAPAQSLCRVQYWNATSTELFYQAEQLTRILDPGTAVTDLAYAEGRLSEVRTPLAYDAIVWSQRADDASLRTAIAYDKAGKVASVTAPAPLAGGARPAHTYTYTSATTTDVAVAGLPSPPAGSARRVTFDPGGRTQTDRNAAGQTAAVTFNNDDLVISTTDTANLKTTHVYDHARRPIETWGPAPASCFAVQVPAPLVGERPLNTSCGSPVPVPVPLTTTAYDEGMAGLAAAYYTNSELGGTPVVLDTGVDDSPDGSLTQNWYGWDPPGSSGGQWSARFTGEINLPANGTYTFSGYADDGIRVYIDDTLVTDDWTTPAGPMPPGANVVTTAGWHPFRVDYHDTGGSANIALKWTTPGQSGAVAVPGANLRPRYGLATSSTDADGHKVSTEYGIAGVGLPTATVVDPGGLALRSTTSYEAPGAGFLRRTARTLPKGAATTVSYQYYAGEPAPPNGCGGISVAGMLKSSTDATPSVGGAIVRQVVYDDSHRVVGRRVATDSQWSCVSYDARGRVSSQTDSLGRVTTVTNAGIDRPITYTDSNNGARSTREISDLLGRPHKYIDELGTTTRRSYTQAGGLENTWRTFTGGAEAQLSATTYDSAGRPSGFTDYSAGTGRTTSFGYDGAGRPDTTALPNAVVTTNFYDANSGALWILRHTRAGNWVANWEATRLASGNIDVEVADTRTRDFGYDGAGRLTSVAETSPSGTTTRTYAYDANTNRCSATGATCGGAWLYDNADRLISSPFASSYTYDSHGNLSSAALTSAALPATAQVIGYDGNDHAISMNDGTSTVYETLAPSGRVIRRVVRNNTTLVISEDVVYG